MAWYNFAPKRKLDAADNEGGAAVLAAKTKEKHRKMPYVNMSEGDNFDGGLRRFKRQVERAGILTEMRARLAYEKPTTRRKRLKIAAIKRLHRKLRMRSLPARKY